MTENYKKPPELAGYNFSVEKGKSARDLGRLLTIRVETSAACNLNCIYCNGDSGRKNLGEISFGQIKSVILQAKAMGAISIVIIGGGEPTVYPHFRDLVTFVHYEGLIPVVITNAQLLTLEMCRFLYNANASVLFKLDSLRENIQDELCGQKGAYKKIIQGLENLLSIGFNKNVNGHLRCGASFVVTKLNSSDIAEIWRFCRYNNLYPNLEQLVPRSRSLKNSQTLHISKEKLYEVKKQLLSFDREQYGFNWLVYSPLCGHGCWQTIYSMYVTSKGYVQPCADIDISFYNIRDLSLADILKKNFFKLARTIEKRVSGICSICSHKNACIGCRGIAFSHGRNIGLSPEEALCLEDPYCPLKKAELDS